MDLNTANMIVANSEGSFVHDKEFFRGAPDPLEKRASGEGTVYATSLVCRAATPETRAHVPYNIVLVDTVEGFRMMAHGDQDLAIGDHVTARFVPFAGRPVPYFIKTR